MAEINSISVTNKTISITFAGLRIFSNFSNANVYCGFNTCTHINDIISAIALICLSLIILI